MQRKPLNQKRNTETPRVAQASTDLRQDGTERENVRQKHKKSTFYLDPAAWRVVRDLAEQKSDEHSQNAKGSVHVSMHDIFEAAMDMYLRAHNKPRIIANKKNPLLREG